MTRWDVCSAFRSARVCGCGRPRKGTISGGPCWRDQDFWHHGREGDFRAVGCRWQEVVRICKSDGWPKVARAAWKRTRARRPAVTGGLARSGFLPLRGVRRQKEQGGELLGREKPSSGQIGDKRDRRHRPMPKMVMQQPGQLAVWGVEPRMASASSASKRLQAVPAAKR